MQRLKRQVIIGVLLGSAIGATLGWIDNGTPYRLTVELPGALAYLLAHIEHHKRRRA